MFVWQARAPTVDPLNAARDRLTDLAKIIGSGATKDEQVLREARAQRVARGPEGGAWA